MAIDIGRLYRRTAKALGESKIVTNPTVSKVGAKAGLGAVAAGAVGLGFLNSVGPVARDAAFEAVMGDPNADVAFTGRKIDTRYLVGRSMGGVSGRMLQYSAPTDAFSFQGPGAVDPRNTAAGSALMGASGAALGVAGGSLFAKRRAFKAGLSAPTRGASLRAKIGFGVAAGIAGVTMGPMNDLLQTRQLMRDNQRFYSESPYATRNSTRSLIHSTNAVGDIVLGMHNSRGGY